MPLPAFATIDNLGARLGREFEADSVDEARAQAALDDASSLIRSVADQDWSTSGGALDFGDLAERHQDTIIRITLAVARRAFMNPDGVTAESIGDASVSYGTSSPDVYLTRAEKAAVLAVVTPSGGVPGLASVRVVAPRLAAGVPAGEQWWEEDE